MILQSESLFRKTELVNRHTTTILDLDRNLTR